jgi:hypothetical protein
LSESFKITRDILKEDDGKDFVNVYNFYMGCYSGKNITYYQKVNMTYKNVHFAMYFLDGKAD